MEENKKSKLGLGILIGLLIAVVLGLTGFIIYDKVLTKDDNNQIENNNYKEENNSEQADKEESNCDWSQVKNSYQEYANNLKQSRQQSINRIDDVTINEKLCISTLTIDKDGNVKLGLENSTLIEKYGRNYQVLTNVLIAGVFEYGNSGFRTILFIKEDGSLVAINGNELINNKTIKLITNLGNVNNIVSLVQTDDNGSMSIMAIDINGNTYDITQYLK